MNTGPTIQTELVVEGASSGGPLVVGKGFNANLTGNTAIGTSTNLNSTTTGTNNVAIGAGALPLVTSGSNNIAIGSGALASAVTGSNNTAIGLNALNTSTANTLLAIGNNALRRNTTGFANLAVGSGTLSSNITGILNTAVGSQALFSNTIGEANTGIGRGALTLSGSTVATFGTITPGSGYTDGTYSGVSLIGELADSTAFPTATIVVSSGAVTSVTLITGGAGIYVGQNLIIFPGSAPAGLTSGTGFKIAVATVNSGDKNTALGSNAGASNITGTGNVFIGNAAGQNETTSDNLYISNTNTATPLIKGKFDSAGGTAGSVQINGKLITTGYAVPTSTSPGVAGEITWDADHLHVCIATNTWKRIEWKGGSW